MVNKEIKQAIFDSNIKKYVIADNLGISDSTFSRKLRKELSQEEKTQILNIIRKLTNWIWLVKIGGNSNGYYDIKRINAILKS